MKNPIIAIIPARQGSRRLPHKNIAKLGSRTLLEWSIHACIDSNAIHDVYVTTDSPVYAEMARRAGAQVIQRPFELCTDKATTEDTVDHALDSIAECDDVEIACLLQCTSPLTKPETVRKAITAVLDRYDTAISVVKAKHRPWWAFEMNEHGEMHSFMNLTPTSPYSSENPPDLYYPTGGVYAFKTDYFRTTHKLWGGLCCGIPVSPLEAIDIDDEFDLGYARYALKLLDNEIKGRESPYLSA